MSEITIMWGFVAVVFPIFLALPAFVAYLILKPSRFLFNASVLSGIVSLVSLWVAIILTEISFLSGGVSFSFTSLIVEIFIPICGIGATITLYYLAIILMDVVVEKSRS